MQPAKANLRRQSRHGGIRPFGFQVVEQDGKKRLAPDPREHPVIAEMAALRRRCRRIVWINPLIGWEGYEPSARGMAAALPYVDLFAPAHTLESLAALEPYLARL